MDRSWHRLRNTGQAEMGRGRSFSVSEKILFRHCDPAGIVFYPRYFEMINDCVEAFFDEIGHPFDQLHQRGGVPRAQIEARFTAPSRHGDRLDLTLTCVDLGRTSLKYMLTGRLGDENRYAASATLVHVNADGRPHPWPADLRRVLEQQTRGHA